MRSSTAIRTSRHTTRWASCTADSCAPFSTASSAVRPIPRCRRAYGYTSIELKVNYLRPVHADSGPLKAVGMLTKPGRRVAFAEGTVEDRHGKLVATASSSLLVFELR